MAVTQRKLQVEYVPIGKLKRFGGNPRRNEETVAAVVKSIEAFGYTNPILARRANNEVIAGHTRLLALKEIGETQAPVIFLDLDETDARVYSVFDNKSVENTQWDFPKLADLFVEFDRLDVKMDLTGFAPEEIESIVVGPTNYQPDPKDDEVPEPPKKAITKRGDLWLLGDHRLLCGDATKAEDVARVMEGDKAKMCFADPPYGVQYRDHASAAPGRKLRKSKFEAIRNDEYNPEQVRVVVGSAAKNMALFCSGAVYVCHPDALLTRRAIEDAFVVAGWPWKHTIIWRKPSPGFGFSDFRNQHECIFYSRGNGEFYGARDQFTVWEHGRDREYEHPTQKPVALVIQAIQNNSKAEDIVVDPFLGSGTTLIAAEKLNRRCYGIEIEPRYCDVTVERWENFTGKKAKRAQGKG